MLARGTDAVVGTAEVDGGTTVDVDSGGTTVDDDSGGTTVDFTVVANVDVDGVIVDVISTVDTALVLSPIVVDAAAV